MVSASAHISVIQESLSEGSLKIDAVNIHASISLPTNNLCHLVMATNTRASRPPHQNPEGPVAKVRYFLFLNIWSGS
jgi:hypothetical protein